MKIIMSALIVVFITGCLNVPPPDEGKYDYCIEWEGWIHRENMFFNCYSFAEMEAKCAWEVDENNTLKLYDQNITLIGKHQCSRYVKTITTEGD